MKIKFLLFIGFIMFLTLTCYAVNKTEKSKPIDLNADSLTYDDKSKKAYLVGHIKITYDGNNVTSDKATFDCLSKNGFFSGNVKLWQEGSTVTSGKMDIFYNEQRVEIYNNVRVVTYKKFVKDTAKNSKNSSNEPIILTCNRAEAFLNKKDVFAYENVKMNKGNKRAFADKAHYSYQNDIVILTGNVFFEDGEFNKMSAQQAVFDLKTETFMATGGVKAQVKMDEKPKSPKKQVKKPLRDSKLLTPTIEPLNDEILLPRNLEEEN